MRQVRLVSERYPVLVKMYDPSELRDEHGRWTAGAEKLREEWHQLGDEIDALYDEAENLNGRGVGLGSPRQNEIRQLVQDKRRRISELAAMGVEF